MRLEPQSDTRRARHAVPLRMRDSEGTDVGVEESEELLAEEERHVAGAGEQDEKFCWRFDFGGVGLDFGRYGVCVMLALKEEHGHLKVEAEGAGIERGEIAHQGLKAGHGNSASVEGRETLGDIRRAWKGSAHGGKYRGIERSEDNLLGGRHGIGVFVFGGHGGNRAVGRSTDGLQFRNGGSIA